MKMSDDKTIERLLFLIKTRGPQTAVALGELVGTTSVAVRQHMEKLAQLGLVISEDRRESVGRPKKYWQLTDKGNQRFPDRHADLTIEMISSVIETFGEAGLDKLIAKREQRSLDIYQSKLDQKSALGAKVKTLAKIREAEGYMAEVEPVEGGFLLHENHCPICIAATTCQGFCKSELKLFQTVLGENADVQRESHIVSGARRCTYRIVEKAP
ncbi:metalloregulator ArsR/SmtB family transcription factor [Maritalea porphyrae]|uniref:helix-turn-helix transcriptional regulator n=1 Tax=Maritalea porphyrae TaxID=880732 RepID=UPI0022B068CD|nr:metalloregulator ArsR/SmtB family transcription factor [Maritalea porphyrae]MCZ4274036.1 transcriptional regulator [Maritalea porphyrae]